MGSVVLYIPGVNVGKDGRVVVVLMWSPPVMERTTAPQAPPASLYSEAGTSVTVHSAQPAKGVIKVSGG